MINYLKQAFFLKFPVPPLGSIPVNILLVLGFLMLGFGHPGFWLLGLGVEATLLFGLASNKRFQRWVDTKKQSLTEQEFAEQWRRLVEQLDFQKQARLQALERKCDQIIEKNRESTSTEYMADSNQGTLRQLSWLYLKLLISQTNLEALGNQSPGEDLKSKIAQLSEELKAANIPDSIKESKTATLSILQKRLENLARRRTSLQEIESDLGRIDAQVDLALENATIQGQPQAISANIELFSSALDENFYGESAKTIANLDQRLRQTE